MEQQLLDDIDNRLGHDERVVLAIDGMAAAGKSTLAAKLKERYSCSVIPMDYFFLRPEQRTPERLAEPGGNIDYERFATEVAMSLGSGEAFTYRPYNCGLQEFSEPVAVYPSQLTVVEGVYCMHPHFGEGLYNISVFMKIDGNTQRDRLAARNKDLLNRFVNEWLPMEEKYFEHFKIQQKCRYILSS